MKKLIKVAFCDFNQGYDPESSIFVDLLKKHFDVQIVSKEDCDYVFFSCWGDEHWFVPEKSVKIFFTGENRTPDFNDCDYSIAFEQLSFSDRHLCMPLFYFYPGLSSMMEQKHLIDSGELLQKKSGFCSFTVSNPNCPPRIEMFQKLCKYKQVDSGGKFLNNIGGPVVDKFEFDASHKFTICFENFSYKGYCTEKLAQAFAAKTIPIYWGDPTVSRIFNTKAFINVHDYKCLDDVVAKVQEIDNNDNLYRAMIETPALVSEVYSTNNQFHILEDFLVHIFCQPLELAQRRTRYAKYATVPHQKEMLNTFYLSKMPLKNRLANYFRILFR